jgi:hypothetical protein
MVGWAPDGRHVVVREGKDVGWLSVNTWRQDRNMKLPADGTLQEVVLLRDGRTLACSFDSEPNFWVLVDAATGKQVRRLAPAPGKQDTTLSPDGRWALAHYRGSFVPWAIELKEVATGRTVWKQKDREPGRYAFSPDGQFLLRVGYPLEVRATVTNRLVGPPASVERRGVPWGACCLSPGGWTLLASFQRYEGPGHDGRLVPLSQVVLIEALTGRPRFRLPAVDGLLGGVHSWGAAGDGVVFSANGRYLVTVGEDGTALVWDVYAATSGEPVAPDRLWAELADPDAEKAFTAVRRLVAAGDLATKELGRRLRPVIADAAQVRQWLADLGDDSFATRHNAEQRLAELVEVIEPDLKGALRHPSLEVRLRVRSLLGRLPREGSIDPGLLQRLRALEALEQIGTPQARQVLRRLAGGAPQARLTREAKAVLDR